MEVEERRSKVDTFLAITGTSDAAAAEAMLDGNGWNVEGAIDFFFATGTTGGTGSADAGGGAAPHVGGQESQMGDDEPDDIPAAGVPGMQDEDRELQMALAASMGQGPPVASSGRQAGGFVPPAFPPPNDRPQFRPPSAPIPPHLRTSSGSDDDDDLEDADADLRRLMQLSAAEGRGVSAEDARLQEVVNASRAAMQGDMPDWGAPHSAGMAGRREVGAGSDAGGAEDDATDRAFLEAALKESLDAPQPAMGDEDDPLLAEAIQASLREGASGDAAGAGGGASAQEDTRSMIERFPALKAQLEAEQRAAAGVGGGNDATAAAMAAAMAGMGDFDFDAGGSRGPPPPPSPGTLEARRVREEQDQAYQESLEMDRMLEESKRQAVSEAAAAEARQLASAKAAAKEEEAAARRAAAELAKMKAELPAEPPAGAGVATVVVRLPDGQRLPPRRFNESDKVAQVYAYVTIAMKEKEGEGTGKAMAFELVSNMPMRTFKDKELSLSEADLQVAPP